MGIKKGQLKKLLVKDLKKIIKTNKIGKITKKTKSQLIAMIQGCDNCVAILKGLSLPIKIKKKASPAQLAAREKFKIMVQKKKQKTNSEIRDLILDKGLKVPDSEDKEVLMKTLTEGKLIAREIAQSTIIKQEEQPKPKKIRRIKKKGKIKPRATEMLNKCRDLECIIEQIKDKPVKEVRKLGKRAFLNKIFGENQFVLAREMNNLIDEATDLQLETFLDMKKKNRKELLQKRFNSSKSLGQLIKELNKKI